MITIEFICLNLTASDFPISDVSDPQVEILIGSSTSIAPQTIFHFHRYVRIFQSDDPKSDIADPLMNGPIKFVSSNFRYVGFPVLSNTHLSIYKFCEMNTSIISSCFLDFSKLKQNIRSFTQLLRNSWNKYAVWQGKYDSSLHMSYAVAKCDRH